MARTDKSSHPNPTAGNGLDEAPEGTEEVIDGGLGAMRLWMSQSLASTQTLMETFTQMQQLQSRSIDAWGQMLESALSEFDQARDAQALMAAVMKLGTRQWALGYQQLGDVVSQLMDTELQLANRLRGEAAHVARHMLPPGGPMASLALGGDGQDLSQALSPLAVFGRLQDQWLANTRRWMEPAPAAPRR